MCVCVRLFCLFCSVLSLSVLSCLSSANLEHARHIQQETRTSNDFHLILSPSCVLVTFWYILQLRSSGSRLSMREPNMLLSSSRYSICHAVILSFLVCVFLAVDPALSQSVDEQISSLPTCSTTCLAKAASNVNCGAGDFVCQCQHQDGIVGILGRVSSQATCLIGDCGISNATSKCDMPPRGMYVESV
jgi:hypothetical protein